MIYTLSPSVLREIQRIFSSDLSEYVCKRLSESQLPLDQSAPPPRVHIAVIWLSKGERNLFDQELEGACRDWRDTLVAAGLANGNWKEILANKGIDCSHW